MDPYYSTFQTREACGGPTGKRILCLLNFDSLAFGHWHHISPQPHFRVLPRALSQARCLLNTLYVFCYNKDRSNTLLPIYSSGGEMTQALGALTAFLEIQV